MRRRDKYRDMTTAELLDLLKKGGEKPADLFEEVRLRLKQHAYPPKPEPTSKQQLEEINQRIYALARKYRASTDSRERGGYGKALRSWKSKRHKLM